MIYIWDMSGEGYKNKPTAEFSVSHIHPWAINEMKDFILQHPENGFYSIGQLITSPQHRYLIEEIEATPWQIKESRDHNNFVNGVTWGYGVMYLNQYENSKRTQITKPLPRIPQDFLSSYTTGYNKKIERIGNHKANSRHEWELFSKKHTKLTTAVNDLTENTSFMEGIMWITHLFEEYEFHKKFAPSEKELKRNAIYVKVNQLSREEMTRILTEMEKKLMED